MSFVSFELLDSQPVLSYCSKYIEQYEGLDMSDETPRVRDFSSHERNLPVRVEASPVYELLLSLFVYGNKGDCDEYECGSTFFEQVEDGVPDALTDHLEDLADCGEVWLPLIGIAQASNMTDSVAALADYLKQMDPMTLRQQIVAGQHMKGDVSDEQRQAAASGDEEAIAALVSGDHFCAGLAKWLGREPEDSHRQLIDTLVGVNGVLEKGISDLLPALRRDADEKRTLARTMEPTALVEAATNGVTFKMQPQISGVLLIPSKIIRPWTVILEHESVSIFAYSVADEHLLADADAPPSYLVDLYKALGDERRLRILAMLSEGDAGLMDIAERLDLAKSTAHHHLRILRSAGLVRVTVGDSKSYSLRRSQIPEVGRMLDAFLTTPAQAAENASANQEQRN